MMALNSNDTPGLNTWLVVVLKLFETIGSIYGL